MQRIVRNGKNCIVMILGHYNDHVIIRGFITEMCSLIRMEDDKTRERGGVPLLSHSLAKYTRRKVFIYHD
jgi:hypothetical protein